MYSIAARNSSLSRLAQISLAPFEPRRLETSLNTEPYMHKGQAATLMDALRHYNKAPDAMIGHNEAKPLGLSARELRQLEAFLLTLAPSGGDAS